LHENPCKIELGLHLSAYHYNQYKIKPNSVRAVMHIEKLRMQNFRGFKDVTIDFPSNLAVFIGENGSGKSSILDCNAVFLSYLMGQIRTFHSSDGSMPPAFVVRDISNGFSETQSEINILVDGMEKEIQLSLALTRKSFVSNGYEALEFEKNITVAIANPTHYDNRSNLADGERLHKFVHDRFRANPMASLPLPIYYSTNRSAVDINLEGSEDHFLNQLNAYDQAIVAGKINFKDFFIWFRNTEDLENEEWRNGNQDYRDRSLEAVRNAISSLMLGFTDLQVKRSRMEMTLKKQGEELVVNQLSDGEKNLLAMVGDLARRLAIANPDPSKNALEGKGIILIDEIELHLHPKWQRDIIPRLTSTFPNCQFIVTTHSPQVLSNVKKENVFIVEDFQVYPADAHTFGRDSNSILSELMGVSERPEEIQNKLTECLYKIDEGQIDEAKIMLRELSDLIGQNDSEIVKAHTLISFLSKVK